ncbi:MAG: PAS domain-containing sensor histidine kinase [Candidatus Woesebacteria bacterium]
MEWADRFAKLSLLHASASVFFLDEHGVIQFANEGAQDFFHLPVEKLIGTSIHAVVHKAPRKDRTHAQGACPFTQLIQSNVQVMRHFDIFWRDHVPCWIEYSINPIQDENGTKAYVVSFLDAAIALREKNSFIENEARYKLIFEVSHDSKLILNKDGIIEEANPVALAFFKKNSIIGENVFTLFPKEGKTAFHKLFQSAKRSSVKLAPLNFSHANGDELFVEMSIFSKFLPGKSLIIFRDTTARILEQRERDRFLALVGHELKTPLAVIKAFTQLLIKIIAPTEDARISRYLQHINEKTDLLTGLINGMLDAIYLGSGKLPFHDEVISFDQLVTETVFELQKTLPHEVFEVSGETKSNVKVDKHRFGQVISNLITNAIKYSPVSEPVEIAREVEGTFVRLSIRDHGIGIPKREQAKLFNPFFRGRHAREGTAKGSGLGLYLARQVMRHYRGTIQVESAYKKGSTFTVELPLTQEESV